MSDPNPRHPQDLIDALLDGTLDAAGLAALEAWLAADAEHPRILARQSILHGHMRSLTAAAPAQTNSELGTRNSERTAASARPVPSSSFRVPSFAYALAAAIAVAAVTVAIYVIGFDRPQPPQREPAVVGILVDSTDDVIWMSEPITHGGGVRAGRIALDAGRVELELHSGVVIELNGPAELDVASPTRVTLDRGRLWTRAVPGFRIDTPRFAVEDLGTEFGVWVDATGGGQVHVLEGSVRVSGGGATQVVTAGRGWAVDAAGVGGAIGYDGAAYGRASTISGVERSLVRYAFDEADGLTVLDTGVGELGGSVHGELAWGEPGIEGPDRVEGRIGRGLRFDGKNDYVTTACAGIGGDRPRTIAMWARIPAGAGSEHALALLGYGRFETGRVWQMSWNSYAADGAVGALRVGVLGDQIIGTTDLRDGLWHHLAASYDGRTARLYVDGRLEAEKPMPSINTATGEDAAAVTIGRNIGADPKAQYFRGDIDEVHLFDTALGGPQVRALFTSGGVASPQAIGPEESPVPTKE